MVFTAESNLQMRYNALDTFCSIDRDLEAPRSACESLIFCAIEMCYVLTDLLTCLLTCQHATHNDASRRFLVSEKICLFYSLCANLRTHFGVRSGKTAWICRAPLLALLPPFR